MLIAVDNSGVQGKVEIKSSGYGSLLRCSISFKALSFHPDNVNPLCFWRDFKHTPLFVSFILLCMRSKKNFLNSINKIDLTLPIIIMLSNQLHMHMNII